MGKLSIGIIGYGDFSKLMIEYLSPYANIFVSSRSHSNGDAGGRARFADLATVLAQPIIIPSIPSQYFEEFFRQNKSLINPNALVVDVCSVKVHPLSVLVNYLPDTVQIIGTHPMFGPASVKKNRGVKGLKCVVAPVRVEDKTQEKFEKFIAKKLKLQIIPRTPEQHDREMAYVQGLSHYIGRIMDKMKIPETELATIAYDDLLDMKYIQGSDSWELFQSIMTDNPYAKNINEEFQRTSQLLQKEIWPDA